MIGRFEEEAAVVRRLFTEAAEATSLDDLRWTRLAGGDINQVFRLEAANGQVWLAKICLDAPKHFFAAEARGLQELRTARALRVPEVFAVDAEGILLEWLEPAAGAEREQGAELGRGLAHLHRMTRDRYGFEENNFIGMLPQNNPWQPSWIDFYREARLLPQMELAAQKGRFGSNRRRLADRLLDRLPEWIDEAEVEPSLLHGDLWGGNWLATRHGPALIDPAVCYGDREMDLAMSRLFGGFPPEFYRAYNEEFPVRPGHQDREALYQLYYLLVHLNLFGESYGPAVDRILRRYGG